MPRDSIDRKRLGTTAYDVFISIAAMASMAIVVWSFTSEPKSELRRLLGYFDFIFCLVFFLDYIRQIVLAPRRSRYIFGWGLLDLASSIPAVGPLRLLRIARVLRILRAIRSLRILVQVFQRDQVGSAIVLSMSLAMGGIILSCVGVLHYEAQAPDGTIKTADDVMWWAVITTSTVGYGDYYPVTGAGRLLATVMMVLGIGLFATLAGAIASRMTSIGLPESDQGKSQIRDRQNYDAVQENMALLKEIKSLLKAKEGSDC